MKVVYITYPSFLDYSIEIINKLQNHVELYVYIIITPASNNSTIFQIDIPKRGNGFYRLCDINTCKSTEILKKFTNKCKDVNLIMFPQKSLSIKSLAMGLKLGNEINKIKPCIYHFDDIGKCTLGLYYHSLTNKTLINIHDPKPHTGEKDYSTRFVRKVMYSTANGFNLFSNYSISIFKGLTSNKKNVFKSYLVPYSSYDYFEDKETKEVHINKKDNHYTILFYGRISKYKGVEDLIDTFIELRKNGYKIRLIIAGKSNYDIKISNEVSKYVNDSFFFINRFIEIGEVKYLMKNCNLLICPYKDATQSGVLMTAQHFKIPFAVSNVGGLPEYARILNGEIFEINNIKSFITKYLSIENQNIEYNNKNNFLLNKSISSILEQYKFILK